MPLTDIPAILDRPALAGAAVAVHVRTLDGEERYALHADRRLMPASNQKVLSCAFAMWAAGPEWRPRTRFWRDRDGIAIDSEGDPLLTFAQLRELRKTVGGGDRVRLSQAYRPGWGPDWEWDDLGNRYAAPVVAFTFDQGAFELWNDNGRARYRPGPFGSRIERGERVSYDPYRMLATVPALARKTERLDTLALPKPDLAAASLFSSRIDRATEPPSGVPTVTWTGQPIAEMVARCLPPSDNLIAENLLFLGAIRKGGKRGIGYPEAARSLRTFLTETVGCEPVDVSPRDGSGLSRHNVVTARAMTRTLAWAGRQSWGDRFREAMASPTKGTMKGRLVGTEFRGKTGSLDMVVGLSGYLRTKKGEELCISILLNHFPGTAAEARAAADDVIRALE